MVPRPLQKLGGDSNSLCSHMYLYVSVLVQYRGFSVHNLVLFNNSLLGKWQLRYAMDSTTLWRRVIEAKYGDFLGGGGPLVAYTSLMGLFMEVYQEGVGWLSSFYHL